MGNRGNRSRKGRAGGTLTALASIVLACAVVPAAAGAVTLRPGDILVTDQHSFGGSAGGVIKVDPTTGLQTLVSNNEISAADLFLDPYGLAFDSRGRILVVDQDGVDGTANGGIVRVDPATGQQTAVSSNTINIGFDLFRDPRGIAVDSAGRILVADVDSQDLGDEGAVIRVDPATGQQTALSDNAISGPNLFADPTALAFDSGGRILVAEREGQGVGNAGAVIRVDPATGQQTSVSDEDINAGTDLFNAPSGIVLDRNGSILIADLDSQGVGGDGAVIRVDPATGQQSFVSNNLISGPDHFTSPNGIALDASGQILVADLDGSPTFGAIVRVDPATGQQTLLASNSLPGDDLLTEPTGVAVFPGLCKGRLATRTGTTARDVIAGTPGVDVVVPLGGNDVVRGLGAGDVVCGGAGNDKLVGGAGKDLLLGEAGKDRLLGGKGRDRLLGGKGRDRLRGGPGRDRLRGGPGRDLQAQ